MDDLGSPLGQEKGRRALRRRPSLATAGLVDPVPLHSAFLLRLDRSHLAPADVIAREYGQSAPT